MKTMVVWGVGLGLVGLVACGKNQPEAAPADAPAASAKAKAPTVAPAASSAAAAAAGVAAAPHAAGPELDVVSTRVVSGKITNGQDKAKLNLPPMEKQCLVPAFKKDPASVGAGTVKLVVAADDQGNILRVKTSTEGKVSADIASCLERYVRREFKFDNTEPSSVEINLAVKIDP